MQSIFQEKKILRNVVEVAQDDYLLSCKTVPACLHQIRITA